MAVLRPQTSVVPGEVGSQREWPLNVQHRVVSVRVVALILAENHLDVIRHVVNIWVANVNVERHVADVGVVGRHHVGLRERLDRAQMFILHVTPLLAPPVLRT